MFHAANYYFFMCNICSLQGQSIFDVSIIKDTHPEDVGQLRHVIMAYNFHLP